METDDANTNRDGDAANSDSNPVPETDLIEDYLGVTALSYDDPSGELTYRVDDDDPNVAEDCVYRIGQTLAVQDGDEAGHQHDAEEVIVDARFEIHLTAAEASKLPALYREYDAKLGDATAESDDETVSTSQLSIKSYPGLFTHYTETPGDHSRDGLNVVWYLQSFPWGMLYWDVIYDPAASVSLEVDPHHDRLRKRSARDWDVPSLAAKSHWQEVHRSDRSGRTGKGRYSGEISPILAHARTFSRVRARRRTPLDDNRADTGRDCRTQHLSLVPQLSQSPPHTTPQFSLTMTLPLQLTRRELLQTSTLGAALPTLSDDGTATDESLPAIDTIAAYLGIPSISYEPVAGELWYRTVDPDPDWSDDCIYCIEQGIAAIDSDIATADLPQPAVIDAGLELRVIPSATPNQPPAAYQHFASLFDPTAGDSDSENQSDSSTIEGVTISKLSVGPYPGLRYKQDATRTGEDMSVLFYAQTLPWGTLHWDIAFDPGLEITLQTDDHQAWLHQRRYRDRNWPAMAPKHHWQELHDGGRSEKGRVRGEIEPIVSDATDIDPSKLHRVAGSIAGSSTVAHEAALSFGDETTDTDH